jgi:hypothetical protein
MTMQPGIPENTAIINIKPEVNPAVTQLLDEAKKLKYFALLRVINTDTDLSPVTNDLVIIAGVKKQLKAYQDEYTQPLKAFLANIQSVFSEILVELDEADKTTRGKINAYREGQKKRAAEAEELNRKAQELARKQAEFSGTGEYTVDTTPLEAPAPVRKVSTTMGSMSAQVVWKWKPIDLLLVPPEYLMLDSSKITKMVKAGLRNIPGILIYSEDSLRVNTRRAE